MQVTENMEHTGITFGKKNLLSDDVICVYCFCQ